MTKKISLFSTVILIIAAIDSIRNLPSSALFGSSLIFFFLFSAIVFLIPVSLISAELSTLFPGKPGVYNWVRMVFGEKWAMVSIWLQWINTMVWYPTILSFIAGTFAYLISPDLAKEKSYLVSVILVVFWILTLVGLKGIHISVKVNNVCIILGVLLPLIILIVLGFVWVFSGKPLQIDFTAKSIFPSLKGSTNWVSLTAIMASFLGMELSGVHANDMHEPQKNFPKALFYSVFILIFTQLLGALTIGVVLPDKEIRLVDGIMQIFTNFFTVFHLQWAIPVLTILIVVGSVGNIINWLISPAKGLLQASEFGYLPPYFSRLNKHGVASRILIAQAILVSLFCLAFVMLPSINAFYWFLTDLSTELYMLMYILMFLAAMQIRKPRFEKPAKYIIPGGNMGLAFTCLLGLLGCVVTLVVGFFPPEEINVGTPGYYATLILLGNLVMVAPVFLFFLYKKMNKKA